MATVLTMKMMSRLFLAVIIMSAGLHAQLLASTQLSLATGSVLTMQLSHNGVQKSSGDAINAYIKIQGVNGEQPSQSPGSINVEALPLTPGVTSSFGLVAAAQLAAVAVFANTTTLANAKATSAQIAQAQLVFTQVQIPSTPPTAAQTRALVSTAVAYIRLTGGSSFQGDFDPDVIISELIAALNLPTPCP